MWDIVAHLLVFLVCWEITAVKNFVFREKCIVSKVASIKTTFFCFFNHFVPTWTHILALEDLNKEFFLVKKVS